MSETLFNKRVALLIALVRAAASVPRAFARLYSSGTGARRVICVGSGSR